MESLGKEIFRLATKTVKKTIMSTEKEKSNQSDERSKHADSIIRNHVIWSMGAGFIPVIVADVIAISALQLDMIRQMCRVYEIDFSETQGKAIVSSLTSSTIARVTAGRLLKIIPGVGSIIGGVTLSAFAGASTYALGEVFKKHFETGGTILDFDTDRLKKLYKEKFEKGKKVVEDWRKQEAVVTGDEWETAASEPATPVAPSGEAILARLKELAALKEQGAINEEEYEQMKKKLIDQF
ncbi:MAG: DUF697 domain-containing protein [Saprospirales bacterium]|nr:DUF697 domain-containing protein [Saprospirales bacterium]MBK8493261.1 DUF697 domain-containing protein [Saprospirales bacterium]